MYKVIVTVPKELDSVYAGAEYNVIANHINDALKWVSKTTGVLKAKLGYSCEELKDEVLLFRSDEEFWLIEKVD